MPWLLWTILACGVWSLWVPLAHWILANPRGDVVSGVTYRFLQLYARVVHRVHASGAHHLPQQRGAGPLIVVCNHTAGVDPILVQSLCPFYIRWMMAQDMKWHGFADVWEYFDLIFVDRTKPDSKALREAIRWVRAGGVVGVFPEARIAVPRGTLLEFQAGLGMIASLTGAAVLPVLIEDTPDARTAWGSLWTPSKSRLTVGPAMRFGKGAKPDAIANEVRAWFARQLTPVESLGMTPAAHLR